MDGRERAGILLRVYVICGGGIVESCDIISIKRSRSMSSSSKKYVLHFYDPQGHILFLLFPLILRFKYNPTAASYLIFASKW